MELMELGCNDGGPSQTVSKTQVNRWSWTQRIISGDLRQPASGTSQQGFTLLHTVIEEMGKSWQWTIPQLSLSLSLSILMAIFQVNLG